MLKLKLEGKEKLRAKRTLTAALAYCTAGIGFYHVFWGNANVYGFIILFMGLAGVLYDVFSKKLHTV